MASGAASHRGGIDLDLDLNELKQDRGTHSDLSLTTLTLRSRSSPRYRSSASGGMSRSIPDSKESLVNSDLALSKPKVRRRKSRSRSKSKIRRRRKASSKAPTYALTIMGKIIYRRLKKSSLITNGISLVKQISSCSLLGWGGKLLTLNSMSRKSSDHDRSFSQERGGDDEDHRSQMTDTLVDLGDATVTNDLNSNINARTITSPGPGSRSCVSAPFPSTSSQAPRRINKTRRKSRKVVLVARSIGKGSKLREPCREKIRIRSKLFVKGGKRSLRKKTGIKSPSRIRVRTTRRVNVKDSHNEVDLKGALASQNTKHREFSSKNLGMACTGSSGGQGTGTAPAKSEVKTPTVSPSRARRKSRRWRALYRLGATEASSRLTTDRAKKKRVEEKRTKESRARRDQISSQSASRSSVTSAHAQFKDNSPEASDWPSLPAAERAKGFAKEVVEEIVKSKCSASVTKMTRRRWADIVSRGNKESLPAQEEHQGKEKKRSDPASGSKTWASVAAANTEVCGSPNEKNSEPCSDPPGTASRGDTTTVSGNTRRKKKKAECGLTYSDRIWLTCQMPRGKAHVQSFYRKHFGKPSSVPTSPSKKSKDKRRDNRFPTVKPPEFSGAASTSSDHRSRSKSKDKAKRPQHTKPKAEQGMQLRATSSNRDSHGENQCLVDNMPVVYTKKAGMVITLNESNHDRPTHKDVNKCNNRADAPGPYRLTRSHRYSDDDGRTTPDTSVSGTDLCSQLSSMTFQTPKTSRCAVSSTPAKSSPQNSSGKAILKSPRTSGAQADGGATRQKKVSLRYRALMRDGISHLDARTVSDIHTRNRRADTMRDDKVATRAMRQKKARLERQDTTHSLRKGSGCCTIAGPPRRGQIGPPDQGRQQNGSSKRGCNPTNVSPSVASRGTGEGTSSPTSSDSDVVWRPADNNGANNSQCPETCFRAPVNRPVMTRRRAIQSPTGAKSAPQLGEPPTNIRVELNANLQTLDMRWISILDFFCVQETLHIPL